MSSDKPFISIVIPMYNSMDTIKQCVASLISIKYPSYEIILVDDGSTDGTAEYCEAQSGLQLIRLDQGGPSRARNIGIQAARGEIVAFTDSDCIVDKLWLTELEKGFSEPDIAGVGGDQLSPDDETETGRLIQDFLKISGFVGDYVKYSKAVMETEHNPSCNSAYKKHVLLEVGGFNEDLWPGEDVELDLNVCRKGYRLVYNPAAIVRHYRPKTYSAFAKMMNRYGASQAYLVRKYGFFRRIHFVPIVLALILVAAIFCVLLQPNFWPIFFIPLVAIFVWFPIKTQSLRKGLHLVMLGFLTLWSWNSGYLKFVMRHHPSQTSLPKSNTQKD